MILIRFLGVSLCFINHLNTYNMANVLFHIFTTYGTFYGYATTYPLVFTLTDGATHIVPAGSMLRVLKA